MSGHVMNLTSKQAATLVEFREKVQDILQERPECDDDNYLIRWLRARGFDLKKSETMLRNSMAWRVSSGADTILEDFEPPEVMQKYFCGGISGQDKEGSFVFIDTQGYTDMKGILMSLKKQDVIKSRMWLLEDIYRQCREKTKEEGRLVDQVVGIFDLEKFGMKNLWKPGVDVLIEVVSMCESNYPETLKKAFVINAPRIFPIAYSLLRPFLSEETHRKVTICGSNYKEVLLQSIDADQLPKHWGGTLTDPDGDPRCPALLVGGGPVPKDYFGLNNLSDLTGFTEVSIGRGSSLQLDFDIKTPQSTIRWQFKTDGFDIGFGLFCRTSDKRQSAKRMDAIIPSQRVNSHIFPEDGVVLCNLPGTYVVRFDNTFSWMRTKKLFYMIEILEPKTLDVDGANEMCPSTPTSETENGDSVWTSFTCNGDDNAENNCDKKSETNGDCGENGHLTGNN